MVIEWCFQVAFTSGAYIRMEPVEHASKAFKFLAMDAISARSGAVVLAMDWCRVHGHLVTAGEDCRLAPRKRSTSSADIPVLLFVKLTPESA
jgi:hypothetical protein